MPGFDTRMNVGDVYDLNGMLLVYGVHGIALSLAPRNVRVVERAISEALELKDTDGKGRRYIVRHDATRGVLVFEIIKGEILEVAVRSLTPVSRDQLLIAA